MKKHTSLFNALIFALILIPAVSFAGNDDDVEKKKTISRSYTVTDKDKLSIDNSFGNVVINTWDKKEIKVDIEIVARANSDDRAQEMLDEMEVHENKSDNLISFKTDIGDINDNRHNKHKNADYGEDRRFYVDYKVSMPATNPLDIENQFGKITLPDYNGEVNLTSKFGGLTTGKLGNVDEIDVEFGTAELGPVHNGDITFKFNGKSHIASVSGNVKIKSEFSGDVQFDIDNSIEELALYESYSTVKMAVNKALSANFDVHTSFGSFHNGTGFTINEDKEDDDNSGPRFDKDYSGKAGDGRAKIKIKSSFGKVRLSDGSDKTSNHDGDDDDKEERHQPKKEKVSA